MARRVVQLGLFDGLRLVVFHTLCGRVFAERGEATGAATDCKRCLKMAARAAAVNDRLHWFYIRWSGLPRNIIAHYLHHGVGRRADS